MDFLFEQDGLYFLEHTGLDDTRLIYIASDKMLNEQICFEVIISHPSVDEGVEPREGELHTGLRICVLALFGKKAYNYFIAMQDSFPVAPMYIHSIVSSMVSKIEACPKNRLRDLMEAAAIVAIDANAYQGSGNISEKMEFTNIVTEKIKALQLLRDDPSNRLN